jgi:Protein of unknown function (DUF3014)
MYAPKRENYRVADENLGRWILGGVVLVALAVGAWFWQKRRTDEPEQPAVATQPAKPATPAIQHPIEPLPNIDPNLSPPEQVAAFVGLPRFEALFVPDDFVRKLVATVDGLARQDIAARMIPAKPVQGDFAAAGSGDAMVLGAANFARYQPWIELVDSLDAESTVALYRRLYPQFQQAYEELGNPDGYFNDRVIQVIDHLLSAPVPPATIALVQPNVFYEFADPALEAESAGRKLLLRMGPGNAARVKMKLRDIRARIATRTPQTPAAQAPAQAPEPPPPQ